MILRSKHIVAAGVLCIGAALQGTAVGQPNPTEEAPQVLPLRRARPSGTPSLTIR